MITFITKEPSVSTALQQSSSVIYIVTVIIILHKQEVLGVTGGQTRACVPRQSYARGNVPWSLFTGSSWCLMYQDSRDSLWCSLLQVVMTLVSVPVDGMFGRQSMFSYGRGRSIISGKGPFVFFQSLCQGPFGLSNVGGGAIIAGYLIYHSSLWFWRYDILSFWIPWRVLWGVK